MANSKLIISNTFFLYIRMLLIMVVSLYTSRLILDALGVSDYGLYYLIAGFVSMFAFLNSSMASATQRFFSFDLGKENFKQLRETFNCSLLIHILIGIAVFIIGETIGLWYILNKLNIPETRYLSAQIVYHFALLSLIIQIIQVPFNALIIAREKMRVYAYVGIIDSILKLLLSLIVVYYSNDKLILYSALSFSCALIIQFFYIFYCKKNFNETKFFFTKRIVVYKQIISFSAWSLFGNIAAVARNQGNNILLNIFFSTTINATYALALQVQGAVTQFVSNFQLAMNPQIIKNYSKNNINYFNELIIQGSRYSFYLMTLLAVPIILNTEKILELWLIDVPVYMVIFTQLSLLGVLIDTISGPLMIGVQATGKIKAYQIVVGGLIFLNLPISYLFLKFGSPPYIVFNIIIIINLISFIFRLFFMKLIMNFPIKKYFSKCFNKILIVSLMLYLVVTILDNHLYLFENVILNSISHLFGVLLIIVFFGLSKTDVIFIKKTLLIMGNKVRNKNG